MCRVSMRQVHGDQIQTKEPRQLEEVANELTILAQTISAQTFPCVGEGAQCVVRFSSSLVCVRHGPVDPQSSQSPAFLMSQRRLAAQRAVQQAQQTMAIDLTERALRLFWASLSLRLAVLFHSLHLQCITDLVHESSQSVICPVCNAQSPSSVDFLHFEHLCCVHHVEASAGECMICSSPQSIASSFNVPCYRQRIHNECLARSVHFCGDRCPLCTQDLVPVLSDPSSGGLPRTPQHSPANSALNSLSVPDDMPRLPPIFPLLCPLLWSTFYGPPDCESLDDRQMEWSPIHPSAQSSSSDWVLQWVCRSCGLGHSCLARSFEFTVDKPTGRAARFCLSCQLSVPHDGDSLPPQTPVSPTPALPPDNDPPSDWFAHGPLTRFASLHGLGAWRPYSSRLWHSVLALMSINFVGVAESRIGCPSLFHSQP